MSATIDLAGMAVQERDLLSRGASWSIPDGTVFDWDGPGHPLVMIERGREIRITTVSDAGIAFSCRKDARQGLQAFLLWRAHGRQIADAEHRVSRLALATLSAAAQLAVQCQAAMTDAFASRNPARQARWELKGRDALARARDAERLAWDAYLDAAEAEEIPVDDRPTFEEARAAALAAVYGPPPQEDEEAGERRERRLEP